MSGYWFGRRRPNDLLRLHGPLGTFFLRDTAGLHLVLLATGTGIAPIKALLGELALSARLRSSRARSTLLWGNRARARPLLVARHRAAAARRAAAGSYMPVLSRAGAGWGGARGHVQQVLLQRPFPLGRDGRLRLRLASHDRRRPRACSTRPACRRAASCPTPSSAPTEAS